MRHRTLGLLFAALAALAFAIPTHASSTPRPAAATSATVAFTRTHNVFLMNTSGGNVRTVTTRGTGYRNGGIVYPWYSWSHDGAYLLLLRMRADQNVGTLLLLNRQGTVLRTLGTIPAPADFWPAWANDADQIAFTASQRLDQAYQGTYHTVDRMDISGHRTYLFTYRSREGCGGGTGDPAEALYWQETGFGGNRPAMSWSMSQGVAAYLASCAGGVNVTNLRTRQTRVLASAQEPALSSAGILAVVDRPNTPSLFQEGVVRLVNPHTGAVLHTVAAGELPTWSRDGRTLYFVQRRLVRTLHARDGLGNRRELRIFSTAIFRSNAAGAGVTRLMTEDAFGFGDLNLTPGGAIIFSRVDNDWAVWRHRTGNVIAPDQGKYAPRVRIQRLNIGGALSTIAPNAGQPVVG